jgi:DNA polymerase (family X)
MDNAAVARALEEIASLLELKDENAFKIRAYRNAAAAIEGLADDLRARAAAGKLDGIPGVGEAIREKIAELCATGKLAYLEGLRAEIPAGVVAMLAIPSLGPKKIRALWMELGVTDVDALKKACEENRLVGLKGFGEKTQKKILDGICLVRKNDGFYLMSDALPVARALLAHLKESPLVRRASIAGSLRRRREIVRDVDLLASSDDARAVMDHFTRGPRVKEILAKGETKTSVRLDSGLQVDLRVVSDAEFPYALAYFTGSKEHNVALRQIAQKKGLKVNEYEITSGSNKIECSSEEDVYAALGLPYFPPEIRENGNELTVHNVPQLIEYKSLKGVFHTHSTWSDGTADIESMAEKARSMGLRYMGLSDHSKAASYANGLDEARLREQMKEVDRLNARWKDFRILRGLECDILPDGSLDLDPATLGDLDFVIGSVHSQYQMPEKEMTERVCRALANEHLDFLGHPTGRLLLSREGYKINLDQVLDAARTHRKVVELNAYPNRLDLDWVHCRKAKEMGVLLSINPDAHSTSDLENIEYGLATARRGWLEAKDVLNTRDLDEVLQILDR